MRATICNAVLARLMRWASSFLSRTGQNALAVHLLLLSGRLSPSASPPFAFARSLWKRGQGESAKIALLQILRLDPTHPEVRNLLGVIFFEEDQTDSAAEQFKQAIALSPQTPAAYNNLGNVHRVNLELDAAACCYINAVVCEPTYVEAFTNLGAIYSMKGDNIAAERYCQQAIAQSPDYAGAYCNLGNVLLSTDRNGEALRNFRRTLQLKPGFTEALVNLSLILGDNSYLIGTVDFYEKQLIRQPANPLPRARIALAQHAMGCWDEARQNLMSALAQKPDSVDALHVLAINYIHGGDARSGIDCLRKMLSVGPNATAQAGVAFNSLYLEEYSGDMLRIESEKWVRQYLTSTLRPAARENTRNKSDLIRIGYVSRDFSQHAVAYFLEPFMKHHDHRRFKIFCYSTLIEDDRYTERFRKLADCWRDIATLPERKITDIILEDKIDILVDLSGLTTGNRLDVFAKKPAPTQVTYLGHPASTGLPTIDYRLGDAVTDPAELTTSHYVEKIWILPRCFLTYSPPNDAPVVTLPPLLRTGYVTFGSFNNVAKITEEVISLWATILQSVQNSKLLMKGFAFSSIQGRSRIIEAFERCGITSERLVIIDWKTDKRNHLELYNDVDIALDPFPYNGTTTTCEALWMGVPVICLAGDRHSGRVGASLLTTLNLCALLAHSKDEYVSISVALAADSLMLSKLRHGMRERLINSALLDHAGFTRNLEQAYLDMWKLNQQSSSQSLNSSVRDNCPPICSSGNSLSAPASSEAVVVSP